MLIYNVLHHYLLFLSVSVSASQLFFKVPHNSYPILFILYILYILLIINKL